MDVSNTDQLIHVFQLGKKYGIDLRSVTFRQSATMRGIVRTPCDLTPGEQREIAQELKIAGVEHVHLQSARKAQQSAIGLAILVTLWGLDPVIAHELLRTTVQVADLTALRMVIFFLVSSMLCGGQKVFSVHRLKPLPPLQPSLILSGVTLFLTALFSYLTLTLIPPAQYILLITAGLALTTFLRSLPRRAVSLSSLLASVAIVAALVVLTTLQGTSLLGLFAGIASSLSFALYSVVSRHYQQEIGLVHARYPAFLFWLSFFGLPFALFLFPFTQITAIPTSHLLTVTGFVAAFNVLPYALYYELTRQMDINVLDRLLLLVIAATIIGEVAVTHSPYPIITLPVFLLLLPLHYRATTLRPTRSPAPLAHSTSRPSSTMSR